MRFLFLLLPNLYDIFTLMMIGYAFMLHQKGELQISFGLACGLIYIATRLGIIAGKILHMILGKPQTDEVDEQDGGGKRFIFDFGPQIICVVAFQVIMMITSLPHSATPAQTDKIAEQDKQAIEQVDQKQDSSAITEDTVASAQSKSEYDELFTEDEDVSTQSKTQSSDVKSAVKTSYAPRKYVAPKAYTQTKVSFTEVEPQQTAQPAPVVEKRPVYIPEKTLSIAGVSPAELNIANVQTTAINNTTNNTQNQVNTKISAVAPATTSTLNSGNLTPKRYPGDDNPIPTTWGYYKQAPTHTTQSQEAAAQNYQNNNNRTIPANTLKVIGY